MSYWFGFELDKGTLNQLSEFVFNMTSQLILEHSIESRIPIWLSEQVSGSLIRRNEVVDFWYSDEWLW